MHVCTYQYTTTPGYSYAPITGLLTNESRAEDVRIIQEQTALLGLNVSLEVVQKIVSIAGLLEDKTALSVSRKQHRAFSHSVIFQRIHTVVQVFISFHKKLPLTRGYEGFSYTESVVLTFDASGNYQRSKGLQKVLKMASQFEKSDEEHFQRVTRRLSIMQDLAECPYFPKNYAFIEKQGKKATKVLIYQELAWGDLMQYHLTTKNVSELPHLVKLTISEELARGLIYLHNKGYVHKDVKPENILVFTSEDSQILHVKLSDFGFACKQSDTRSLMTKCGTLAWTAPEMILWLFDSNRTPQLSKQLDAWAFGLLLYNLCSPVSLPLQDCLQEMNAYVSNPRALEAFSRRVNQHLSDLKTAQESLDSLEAISTALVQREPASRLPLECALDGIVALKTKDQNQPMHVKPADSGSTGCAIF